MLSRPEIDLSIVHTGQHYDYELSKQFFDEFDLPEPNINLEVGSGTHGTQTGKILTALEGVLSSIQPNLVIIPGDTNSALAGGLVAARAHLPIAHLESGARSFNMQMPEEINRVIVDHLSSLLLVPTQNCKRNLIAEGTSPSSIKNTGDTMLAVLYEHLSLAEKSSVLDELSIDSGDYIFVTVHRESNMDGGNIKGICEAVMDLHEIPIIFPIHPRTRSRMVEMNLFQKVSESRHVHIIDPVRYHDSIKLIKNAKLVMTDSGGVQKEAFWLRVPTLTLRENTEWVEIVNLGWSSLVGSSSERILANARRILEGYSKPRNVGRNPFGTVDAPRKAADAIISYIDGKQ